MPSLAHEALLMLFRNRPTLAPELLRQLLAIELPSYSEARVESASLSEVSPTEYQADLVVLLWEGLPVYAIVVEVQLARDEDKRFTWPLYAMSVRARWRCDACVLVVTPHREVAEWAGRAIETGAPGSVFLPLVLGPEGVPWVTQVEQARAAPELAVLSAMAHGQEEGALPVAVAALEAALGLDDERARLYYDLVVEALNEPARRALEERYMGNGTYQFRSEFARKYIGIGKEEGRAEGKAGALLRILDQRGIGLTEEQRSMVWATSDLELLDRWIDLALVATSASEIFERG